MTFDVLVFKIITNYSGSWPSDMGSHTLSADNFIHVLLDDVTETFVVKYQASPNEGINILGTLSAGPNLFFGFDGLVELLTTQPYYQWCDGTTLNKVNVLNNFPYSFLSFFPGALECVIAPTCDLEIDPLYSITEASGPAAADGAITVNATSSNGTIKYSLDPDFDYATAGQTSPTFSALLPQFYTIYAKDAIGCQDNVTFEIPVTTEYGVRHRLDFTDLHILSGKAIRYDIEERAYVGPIEEMCGGGKPVVIRYEGDRDEIVHYVPSYAELEILVETNGQYTHLHTVDDRKYKGKLYIGDDFLSLELYHIGYAVPQYHQEPYLFEPYYLTVTFADQLGELKNQQFLDFYGNKIKGDLKCIKIIAEILKKTQLNLNIRCGVNVFETNMNQTAADDPYDQAYVDTRIFYNEKNVPDKCDSVIQEFVKPFRAQLFQSMGYWWIIRMSDAVGTFAYREFDVNGDYVSNSTFSPVVDLGTPTEIRAGLGAFFINRSQLLQYVKNYGHFSVINNLKKDGNLIDEGRFEEEDVIDLGSGNQTFKNWNHFLGQAGVTAGFEAVVNGVSMGAAFLDFTLASNPQGDSYWYSNVMPMDDNGAFRFKFQYLVDAKYKVPHTRIAWALKFTTTTSDRWLSVGANGALQYELTEVKNEVYVTEFGKWLDFEIYNRLDVSGQNQSVQIFVYTHNHYGRDFGSLTAFRAFNPGSVENPNGLKRMVTEDVGETRFYTSSWMPTAVDDGLDTIVPDDFAPGNQWAWKLDSIINIGQNVGLVNRFKLDNLSLAFYPLVFTPITQYIEPPETLTYEELVSDFVESDFSETVLLGDMIRFNNEFTRNERNLYRSYFRFSDGTPTELWARSGVLESKRVLQILLDDYVAQFSEPQRKLSGAKITNTVLHFVNCLRDTIDGMRYRPMTFEFDVLNAIYTPDIVGVIAGEDGDPPYDPGQFHCRQFSSAFKRGSCLAVGVFDDTFDESFE